MRYYNMVLNTNAETLDERATVDYREYRGDNPITAMNNYIYKHIENGLVFFAYREEGPGTYAVFSYDERKFSFQDAHDYMTNFQSAIYASIS